MMTEPNNSQELPTSHQSEQDDPTQASHETSGLQSVVESAKNINNIITYLKLLFSKSKNVMLSNGLVALGTVGSEELYYWLAFQCPCASTQNYWYGLMTIVLPTLVLFIFSIILNNETWHMGANCHSRKPRYTFQLLCSIVGKAAMAPVIWSIILLLHGEAYICAFSEFVNPNSISAEEEKFPVANATQFLARFPCMKDSDPLSVFRNKVRHKLLLESQLLGWLLISMAVIFMFLAKCFKHCCSKFTQTYRGHYIASEEQFLRQTAKIHARVHAADNVEYFFDFVVLNKKDKKMREKYKVKSTKKNCDCGTITVDKPPKYSLLHKWIQKQESKGKKFGCVTSQV